MYVIYINERLAYIGQTNNVNVRLTTHAVNVWNGVIKTRWGRVADVYVKIKCPTKIGAEAMLERRLILRLKPKYNKKHYGEFGKNFRRVRCF